MANKKFLIFDPSGAPYTAQVGSSDTVGGFTVEGAEKIQFGAATTFIGRQSSTHLEIGASGSVIIDSPVLDLEDDGVVLRLGADSDVSLTHVHDTGLLLNSTRQLQFGDSGTYIHQSADGVLDLVSDTEIEINATTVDINGNVDVSGTYTGGGLMTVGGNIVIPDAGTIGSATITGAIAISNAGVVSLSATTEASAVGTAAFVVAGGASVAKDLYVGDDLMLDSDAAVLGFGDHGDVTLTHSADAGLVLNSGMKLFFRDAGDEAIYSVSDGVLGLVAGSEIDLTATSIDINGAIVASSTITAEGRIIVNDVTEATSATDGSVQTDGGLSVAKDIIAGNDIFLLSDSAALGLGAGKDVTITHDGGTGATLASAGAFVLDGANAVTVDSDAALVVGGATVDIDADGGAASLDGTGGVNIGTATSGVAVSIGHTTSTTTVNDDLVVTGDLTVNGTTTTVNSTTVTIDDPVFTLGGDSAPSSDDNKDRGIEFRYHDGSNARVGFMGWDDSASGFTLLSAATNSSEVFSGTASSLVIGALTATSVAGSTGTFSGVLKTDDATEATSTTNGSLQTDGGLSVVKSAVIGDDLDLLSDAAVLNFGADKDVNVTHVPDTGLLLNSTSQLQFGDSGTYIHQSADGVLDLVSDTEIEINATTIDVNGALDASSSITAAGRIIVDDTTDATSATDGSIQTDGGLSVAKVGFIGTDLKVGDDVFLTSDSSVINMGAGNDVTFTHDGTTGVTIAAAPITLDSSTDIVLDADGDDITFKAGTADATGLKWTQSGSGNWTNLVGASDKDLIFQVNDGGSATEVMRLDGDVSALKMASGKQLQFGAAEEYISGDGTDITFGVGAGGDINIPANIGLVFDGGTSQSKIECDDFGNTTLMSSQGAIVLQPESGNRVEPSTDGSFDLGAVAAFSSQSSISGFTTNMTSGQTFNSSMSVILWDNDNCTVGSAIDGAASALSGQTQSLSTSTTTISVAPGEIAGGTINAGDVIVLGLSSSYMVFGVTYDYTGQGGSISVKYLSNGTGFSQVTSLSNPTAMYSITFGSSGSKGAPYLSTYTAGNDVALVATNSGGDLAAYTTARNIPQYGIFAAVSFKSDVSTSSVSIAMADATSVSRYKYVARKAWSKLAADNVVMNGEGRIDLDADDDTSIRSSADDQIDFEIGGSDLISMKAAGLQIVDDKKLMFGSASGGDASFEYDEDGNDVLLYAGASMRFGDDIKLEFGAAGDASIEYDEDGTDQLRIAAPSAGVVIAGTTPTLVIGDAGAEDAKMVFDGNAQDFHMGLDDSADDLVLGVGSTLGTTTSLALDEYRNVDIAAHNASSVGLKLGGTLVSASAVELNYSDLTTLGTSEASKVVSADASGDITIAGAAANMVWDKSEDALEFADNASIEIGTGLDMKLYHDGSNSYITNATGALKLATETSGIAVSIGHSTSETTVNDNLTVTGTLSMAADLVHTGDANNKIAFGTDTQSFETGGTARMNISDSGLQVGSGARVTTILDENDFASDSDTALATQQSIKAYVDSQGGGSVISGMAPAGSGGPAVGQFAYISAADTLKIVTSSDLETDGAGAFFPRVCGLYLGTNQFMLGGKGTAQKDTGTGTITAGDPVYLSLGKITTKTKAVEAVAATGNGGWLKQVGWANATAADGATTIAVVVERHDAVWLPES